VLVEISSMLYEVTACVLGAIAMDDNSELRGPTRLSFQDHMLTCRYNDDLSLEDAIHTALLTLKEGFEGQMTENTIEIGVVTVPTREQMQEKPGERLPPTFRKLTEAEVRDYLAL